MTRPALAFPERLGILTNPYLFYMSKSILDPARIADIEFSNDEIARYSRHLIMPEVTLEGQKRLKAAKVLCIGTGGLGSPIGLYLAAAGIGTLGLVDFDVVDYSNLQRQILHGTKDVGRKKLNSARDRIKEINPNVQVELHDALFSAENAREIVEPYDIVIDGTDNFPTRYLSNDICVFLKKPNVYGSIFRFDGQCTVFAPILVARATDASTPSHRHQEWCRAVPKVAFWAFCRESSVSCRQSRPSSSSSVSVNPHRPLGSL